MLRDREVSTDDLPKLCHRKVPGCRTIALTVRLGVLSFKV